VIVRLSSAGDGTPVIVNSARIFTVRTSAAGTAIMSAGGSTVYVKQSLKEVEKRIAAATGEATIGPEVGAAAVPTPAGPDAPPAPVVETVAEAAVANDAGPKDPRPKARVKKA
jgi:uncharacterized protein YlzI (FlbEa/FlbD family)